MRKLYLFLIFTSCIIIILLVGAFFYIDTHRHHIFYYNIQIRNIDTATVKLDKYVTEGNIIYHSFTNTPFHSTCKIHKRKLVLDKRDLRIRDYNKKELGDRTSMDIYLKRMNGNASFLAIGHSGFSYLDRFTVDKDFVIFEEDTPISYASIVAKYDFKKRGLQRFQALSHTLALLPPIKQTITLRRAEEKTIEMEDRKVDALRMILKLPDYKEVSIWINKWSHTILEVENPGINFKATWVSNPKSLAAKDYVITRTGYIKKEVSFKNKDILLSGTLTIPETGGPHPAILAVWGPGPLDREGLGMFTNMADYFASKGIAFLSFDKRGVGKSQGKFSRFAKTDTIEDLEAALDFLCRQKEIDKTKLAILGHSEGSYYASSLASARQDISACIIMAGTVVTNICDTDLETIEYLTRLSPNWDKEYLADIKRAADQTTKIIRQGKDWALLLGKRVYLKKARLDLENKPLDAVRKLKMPTLILQGKKDTIVPPEQAILIEEALKEGGNQNHSLVFFNALGYFFGNIVQDGVVRTHLTTNELVMDTIVQWLKDNLIAPKKATSAIEVPEKPEEPKTPESPVQPVSE